MRDSVSHWKLKIANASQNTLQRRRDAPNCGFRGGRRPSLAPTGASCAAMPPRESVSMFNFLEQLVAEWYEFQGYFVRRNVRVGPRAGGGHAGELDVVAFHP